MNFGETIQINNRLIRLISNDHDKYWAAWKSKPKSVIFLGYRTLSNGQRDYDMEEGYTYRPSQHFKAALVCENSHTNPFYVLIDVDIKTTVSDTRKMK